ncbi:glycosyltransferase [Pseudescherichia vulneris]
MKFSVLLSLYHKENPEYLNASLESISKQSRKADEVVIVLDGPVGQELENILESWINQLPIKIIRLSENVGLGQALNEGLDNCTNEMIFRMDTDDICCGKRFEKQIDAFESDPKLVLLGGQIDEYDETMNNLLGIRKVPVGFDSIKKNAKFKNPFNHMTVAFKKTYVQAVGGYVHHSFMEDYNLWLRMIAANYKVDNLKDTLVLARTGRSMLERRKGIDYLKSEVKLFNLKNQLKLISPLVGAAILILRASPRLFPTSVLHVFYKIQRKGSK